MTIKVGDRLPDVTLRVMTADGPAAKTTSEIFKGKKIVLFAVPGAFTRGCHRSHMPGYVQNADAIKAKGVDAIMVTAVNDAFVMDAWTKASNAEGKITPLADGSAEFAKAVGLEMDATGMGLGMRSKRYAMVIEDGVVKSLEVEPAPGVSVSGAEHILKTL
jgi:peroxiredoxin